MTTLVFLASTQTSSTLIGIVLVVLAGFVYFLPAITARERKVPEVGTVFILNLLLGWTLIGWVVALAMAYRTPAPKRAQLLAEAFAAAFKVTVRAGGFGLAVRSEAHLDSGS